MTEDNLFEVEGYHLAADRHYDAETHLWISAENTLRARCGFDPLGSETSGDIVAVAFEPPGRAVNRGEAFGSIEAAKFVGPLISPVSGVIRESNPEVVFTPSLLNLNPLEHWMIEIELSQPEAEVPLLLHGRDGVTRWFAQEIERFRTKGMIAE